MESTIENFVGIYENAFSKEYCDDVINQFNLLQEQGFTKTRQQNDDGTKDIKDDTSTWTGNFYNAESDVSGLHRLIGQQFNDIYWGQCYEHYADNFSILKSSPSHAIWGNKVQRTNIGQGYHVWHYEDGSRECCQRLLTHLVYLNDVEEGGETELLYYHKRFAPKTGTVLIFPAGYTHTHRGNPPLSNDKYIITGWTEF